LGGMLFAVVFIPYLSLWSIAILIALVNIFCLFFILFVFCRSLSFFKVYFGIGLLLAVGFLFFGKESNRAEQYFLQKIYYQEPEESFISFLRFNKNFPVVTRVRSAYQVIDIVPRTPENLDPVLRMLCKAYSQKTAKGRFYEKGFLVTIDGAAQFHSDIEEFYHEYFAHIPILLQKSLPKTILVLGGGDGMLIRELLKYPSIERIDHVDIDPVIVELSKTREDFLFLNQGSLWSPKVHTFIQDGYHYLRTCQKTYDAIYLDFPIAYDYNVNKLYSFEFYSFAQRHLNPEGYLVFDIGPFSASAEFSRKGVKILNRKKVYIDTVRAAGFQTVIPYSVNLEPDNSQAREIIGRYYMDFVKNLGSSSSSDEEVFKRRDAWVDRVIESFCQGQRDGYIFATRDNKEFDFTYKPLNISFYTLNEKRFKSAFFSDDARSRDKDTLWINSIMKPVLLNM